MVADVVVADITQANTFVDQTFSLTFVNQSASQMPKAKSGNPGYLFGKPVVSGYLVSDASKQAIIQSVYGIKALTGNTCTNSSFLSIPFGVDTITACKVTVASLAEFQSLCTGNTFSAITQAEVDTYVGRFGNADQYNINDWIPIVDDTKPSSSYDALSQTCSITGGIGFDFVIAKAGPVYDEQYRIVGVRRYRFAQTWRFDSLQTTNDFWIQYRISFILTPSQSVSNRLEPLPTLLPSLPEDMFYPFSLLSSSATRSNNVLLCILMCIAIMLIL